VNPNPHQSPISGPTGTTSSAAAPSLGLSESEAAEKLVRRSRATTVSLWGVGITNAAALVTGVFFSSYLQSLESSAVIEELEFVGFTIAYGIVGLAKLIALMIAGVFFIRWFYLAHQNVSRLDGSRPKHHSWWSIWGFFVPVINMFRPQQLMREVWTITSGKWEAEPSRVLGRKRPSDCVDLWWGTFLATNFLGNSVTLASWRATTAHEILLATWATLFADVFGIVAVLVAVTLVGNVTALQRPILGNLPTETVATDTD